MNLALVGYGFVGATFHAPLIAACPRLRLAAIVTSQADRAKADWPGAAVVPQLADVLADASIDAVVLATPTATHAAAAEEVLRAGKHLVLEKPIATNADDARALVDLARARGLLLAPFHNRRFDGDFLVVKELVAGGRLGRITYVESHFDRFRPDVRDRWRERAGPGAGVLLDLGPHLVDQALALFGMPRTVTATVRALRPGGSANDYVHLQLGYPDKEVVLHATMLSAIDAPRFVIHGTRGSYVKHGLDVQEEQLRAGLRPGDAGWGGNAPGRLRVDGRDEEVPTPSGRYTDFYDAFAASVLDGAPFPIAPDDAVDGLRLLDLAGRSESLGAPCVSSIR